MKKVCVFTATRAEYGILTPLLYRIQECEKIELIIIALGAHLSPEYGYTYKEIIADGFTINERIETLMSSDSSIGVCKTMGLIQISSSEIIERVKPDLAIILGDRYEMLSIASTAAIMNIPIAHIHGGEITEGAIDDSIRHAITKLSTLHFTSTEIYKQRVLQLGENPLAVFNVGALGIENIKNVKYLTKKEMEKSLNVSLEENIAVVTFHPVTTELSETIKQIDDLFNVLIQKTDFRIIVTKSNADEMGRAINNRIDEFADLYPSRISTFTSLGRIRYLSLLRLADLVIGNSSSGIIEAPEYNIPIINVGNRQKGRASSPAVIHCDANYNSIAFAVEIALAKKHNIFQEKVDNIYGDGNTSNLIMEVLIDYLYLNQDSYKKKFCDLNQRSD